MKRLLAILGYTLVLFVAIACIFGMAFAEDFMCGTRYRFEGGILDNPDWEVDEDGIIREVYIYESESDDTEFFEITRYRTYLYDEFGYYPEFDIDYDDQIAIFYLYRTELHVPCIVDRLSQRVFIPNSAIDEEIIRQNELFSMTEELSYYSIFEIDSLDYRIIDVDANDKHLLVTIESYVDGECGKTFDVMLWNFEYDEDFSTYFIDREEFRKLWYEVYRY